MDLAITNHEYYILIVCWSRKTSSSVCLELPINQYYLIDVWI